MNKQSSQELSSFRLLKGTGCCVRNLVCDLSETRRETSFELKISFTKQTPIVDRAALLSKTKDESVVDKISSLVSMMSVSDLPSKGNSLTLGAFKQGKQVSLNDRVTVTLTRGSELFGSAGEMSGRK